MADKKKTSQDDEINTFYDAMHDIKPLAQNKIQLAPRNKNPLKTVNYNNKCLFQELFPLYPKDNIQQINGNEAICFNEGNISGKILRNLREGHYPIDAKIDLHGLSVKLAKTIVEQFIWESYQSGMHVLLIIHGKGHHTDNNMPVLKNMLNKWLRHTSLVAAFCSAKRAQHGNSGAIYILLNTAQG